MDYLTAKEIALRWGVTARRVQDMCRNGDISGAVRHGREWLIPADAERISRYDKDFAKTKSFGAFNGRERVYSAITELYKIPGTAEELIKSVDWDDFTHDMLDAQISFYQGNFERTVELSNKYLTEKENGVEYRVAVGWQYVLAAIYTGDIGLWKRGNGYMAAAKCDTVQEKNILDFWTAAAASAISDISGFPEWFRRGDFSHLPDKSFATAAYHYVKYLYIACNHVSSQDDRKNAIAMIQMMPYIIEPLITKIHSEKVLIIEIYLRLLCALAYHICGRDELAVSHLDKAIELAMPDKLYSPLGEYRQRFGFLLDDRVSVRYADALPKIKKISKSLTEGWAALHTAFLGRKVTAQLSTREYQASKLTVYGLTNKEIADRMGITVNAVKQALRLAMDKTGAESRSELSKYI